jgi:hypothetical protein
MHEGYEQFLCSNVEIVHKMWRISLGESQFYILVAKIVLNALLIFSNSLKMIKIDRNMSGARQILLKNNFNPSATVAFYELFIKAKLRVSVSYENSY